MMMRLPRATRRRIPPASSSDRAAVGPSPSAAGGRPRIRRSRGPSRTGVGKTATCPAEGTWGEASGADLRELCHPGNTQRVLCVKCVVT